ncbi:MAG: peptide ABC transporter ATP-binding protein [Candidatus Fraserbacteria bacterium RBG_16_55_9]|uniref:Peptide ABC transporter ATP-binding protein n=1 Tax=Fraserbacteria sp. (strain RBG_16_55_9) TaxID=1817864 RepID=A0A1F5V1R1_FRAXR|nr:MAG: peptide ABC transporter ATP-binding protein [Candidatus Fraserbacteria bacterium RBG_16_55_9]
MANEEILLEVKALRKYFPVKRGIFRRTVAFVKAVDGIDFFIKKGETLGLVGESGCGKTTAGRTILRLIEPDPGSKILFHMNGQTVDIAKLRLRQLKPLRRQMQIIFQDPYSSLNPRMTIGDIVGEPLVVHGVARGKEREARVRELLEAVGLNPAYMKRYPHEFSGGQRQRIGIARALALDPQLIICDEPVSALDVSIQAQVLNLLEDLQKEFGLTYLFIAHDLSVVRHISSRIAVMYLGKVVEMADTEELFKTPMHPYTEALLSAVPVPDPAIKMDRIILEGDVPSPVNPPSGCVFHPRCPYYAKNQWATCKNDVPPLVDVTGKGHYSSCHFAKELKLQGVEEIVERRSRS